MKTKLPSVRGLYHPEFEKDSCGVGFIAHIKGEASHQIVADANQMLINMDHRGACGCEANTGDGAGILTAIPDTFFRKVTAYLGFDLPEKGRYGTGNFFFGHMEGERQRMKDVVEEMVAREGLVFIGWRDVPTDPVRADLGPTARSHRPYTEQPFIGAPTGMTSDAFERKLYHVRKRITNQLRLMEEDFYACSLSARTIIYKGRLTPEQVVYYYPDLADLDYESHLAMVHSRFSTNTFPSWDRAQPKRMMAHNGEINTLKGNVNWMYARQGQLKSDLIDISLAQPICEPDTSDSGNFDNVLELLVLSGRSLPEAIAMMIPEAWENHEGMSVAKRAFYEYHAHLLEPWDGPASISFTDGRYIGAVLDRNGLRPSRYYVTKDDRVIMASEAGVLPIAAGLIQAKGRLQPGRMFLVDFEQGRIVPDEELKKQLAEAQPYESWLRDQQITLSEIVATTDFGTTSATADNLMARLKAFGYTTEHLNFILRPMIKAGSEPLFSMGNDAPLAPLSHRDRLLYDYFQQHFAQVTNPPIDSTREYLIMSLQCYVGPQGNLLAPTPESAHRLRLDDPILSNEEMAALKKMNHRGWTSSVIDITYPVSEGVRGLEQAIDRVCKEVERAIWQNHSVVILSDRLVSHERIAVSSLLASSSVHHHLIRTKLRTRVALILETGEAREVHHHAVLLGYGADAINPYLVFESAMAEYEKGAFGPEMTEEGVVISYKKGVSKGILKVMAKMGISTLQSYKGAQIFEAVGLDKALVEKSFSGTISRIGGISYEELAEEALQRHRLAFPEQLETSQLDNPGEYHWRSNGERHMWTPEAIAHLQKAARINSRDAYDAFAQVVDGTPENASTLRSLLRFKKDVTAIPLNEVEPASEIVKRFVTGAMSLGSISTEAHETLAVALNRLGGKSNTGEGGEDYFRFETMSNGDSKRSAIKQVASGRFGVTMWYLHNADELQIKMAQGAKPGEGGELPGHKVSEYIASVRRSMPGVGLISPPPHHDIYSIEDLSQLIHDLKNANPRARISVKLVSEAGVGTIAAGVAKAKADHILISGHDGGTGASPINSIKHAGLPWELGLAETHQTLVMNGLRSRVTVQTDGQLKTGRDVVIAAILGAEEFGFATAPLITMGCIMMRKCHLNTCPVGVATQDPVLRKKFKGLPEHVVNYLWMVAEHTREIMASLGVKSITELVGRVELIEENPDIRHWKTQKVDLSALLVPAESLYGDMPVVCSEPQDHGLMKSLDNTLIALAFPALEQAKPIRLALPVKNTDRVIGAMLSNEIVRRFGEPALPEDTIWIKLRGSAGQSLGAFTVQGVTLEVEGDANDYVGKGLSGGKLVVYPDRVATFRPQDHIVVGNVCFYGATSGEAYIRGQAAERFAVRNSGAKVVVEGVGDHGCEYMTGGRVVILGPTGRNFAAGMSGGVAYVLDPKGTFERHCNTELVNLEGVTEPEELMELHELISRHLQYTGSTVAEEILNHWQASVRKFVKVMPRDYKQVLSALKQKQSALA